MEHVFPFRRVHTEESPASLLWGTEAVRLEGDPREGMFDKQAPMPSLKPMDLKTLKAIYASAQARSADTTPTAQSQPSIPLVPTSRELKTDLPIDSLASLAPFDLSSGCRHCAQRVRGSQRVHDANGNTSPRSPSRVLFSSATMDRRHEPREVLPHQERDIWRRMEGYEQARQDHAGRLGFSHQTPRTPNR